MGVVASHSVFSEDRGREHGCFLREPDDGGESFWRRILRSHPDVKISICRDHLCPEDCFHSPEQWQYGYVVHYYPQKSN